MVSDENESCSVNCASLRRMMSTLLWTQLRATLSARRSSSRSITVLEEVLFDVACGEETQRIYVSRLSWLNIGLKLRGWWAGGIGAVRMTSRWHWSCAGEAEGILELHKWRRSRYRAARVKKLCIGAAQARRRYTWGAQMSRRYAPRLFKQRGDTPRAMQISSRYAFSCSSKEEVRLRLCRWAGGTEWDGVSGGPLYFRVVKSELQGNWRPWDYRIL